MISISNAAYDMLYTTYGMSHTVCPCSYGRSAVFLQRHSYIDTKNSLQRSFMNSSLSGYDGYQVLNADESPFYPFRNRGKIVVDKAMINIATWKNKDDKRRVTFFQLFNSLENLDLHLHSFWIANVLDGQ